MMTNLFSIFDPNTSLYLKMNWLSSLFNILLLPMFFWMKSSRLIKFFNILVNILLNEFKIILLNKFNKINMFYFISLFMFILFNNFMGLFPYIFTNSSHLIFSLSISLPLWMGLMMFMWLNNTNFAFSHLIPMNTPLILAPFMVLVESISNIIRPLTLSVRLTANMTAGHLLLTLLGESAISSNLLTYSLIIIMQMMLLILEFSVAMIQSYVFTILTTLYIKETNYVKIPI